MASELTVGGITGLGGADTVIDSETTASPILTLRNRNGDANGPQFILYKRTSDEANDDVLGTVRFKGYNSASEETEYATIYAQSSNVADGAEDGTMIFRTMKDGTLSARLTISSAGNVGVGGAPVGKMSIIGGTATAEASHITFENTAGAKVFAIGGGKSQVSNNDFCVVNVTDDTAPLTISDSGISTFSAGIAQGGTSGDDTANIDANGILNIRRASGVGRNMINFHNGNDGSGNATFVGGITSSTSATQYNTSSDYRLKENVTELTGALDRLDSIPVYNFNFKADPTKTVDGFLAHEVSEFVPEAITGTKDEMQTVVTTEAVEAVEAVDATLYVEGDELPDGVAIGDEKTPAVEAVDAVAEVTEEQPKYQGIDQSKLVPLMLAAIKELKAKVTALENA